MANSIDIYQVLDPALSTSSMPIHTISVRVLLFLWSPPFSGYENGGRDIQWFTYDHTAANPPYVVWSLCFACPVSLSMCLTPVKKIPSSGPLT